MKYNLPARRLNRAVSCNSWPNLNTPNNKRRKFMKTIKVVPFFTVFSAFLTALLCLPLLAYAHCDTLDGPVVQTARESLEKSDITPVLKWVQVKDEKEIRAAFDKALAVRAMGPEAKELADMYFFETLVRIHRAGEGAPYTGLKPGAAVDPAVALADKALES